MTSRLQTISSMHAAPGPFFTQYSLTPPCSVASARVPIPSATGWSTYTPTRPIISKSVSAFMPRKEVIVAHPLTDRIADVVYGRLGERRDRRDRPAAIEVALLLSGFASWASRCLYSLHLRNDSWQRTSVACICRPEWPTKASHQSKSRFARGNAENGRNAPRGPPSIFHLHGV